MTVKRCKNCNNRKALYVKKLFRYWRHGEEYCSVKDELTNAESFCEHWQTKIRERYDLSDTRLREAEEDIKFLIALYGGEK